MYIKSIVWRKLIYGQVRRLTLGVNVPETCTKFKKLRADHAFEWGNKNENPGVWADFVDSNIIPLTPEFYSVKLDNSENDLKLWRGNNNPRGNKIKISQRIWSEQRDIIEIWYLGSMKILEHLLCEYNKTEVASDDSIKLFDFVSGRLKELQKYKGDLFRWAKDTQDDFKEISINPNFLFNDFFKKTKKNYIEKNYLLLISIIDDDKHEKNHALMANLDDEKLHPFLQSVIKGDCGAARVNKALE